MSKPAPVSVVETPEFLAATKRIMDEQERMSAPVKNRRYLPQFGLTGWVACPGSPQEGPAPVAERIIARSEAEGAGGACGPTWASCRAAGD
jgi:hypothetical protein